MSVIFIVLYGLGKATMDAMLHSVRSRLSFPSWTPRFSDPDLPVPLFAQNSAGKTK